MYSNVGLQASERLAYVSQNAYSTKTNIYAISLIKPTFRIMFWKNINAKK